MPFVFIEYNMHISQSDFFMRSLLQYGLFCDGIKKNMSFDDVHKLMGNDYVCCRIWSHKMCQSKIAYLFKFSIKSLVLKSNIFRVIFIIMKCSFVFYFLSSNLLNISRLIKTAMMKEKKIRLHCTIWIIYFCEGEKKRLILAFAYLNLMRMLRSRQVLLFSFDIFQIVSYVHCWSLSKWIVDAKSQVIIKKTLFVGQKHTILSENP